MRKIYITESQVRMLVEDGIYDASDSTKPYDQTQTYVDATYGDDEADKTLKAKTTTDSYADSLAVNGFGPYSRDYYNHRGPIQFDNEFDDMMDEAKGFNVNTKGFENSRQNRVKIPYGIGQDLRSKAAFMDRMGVRGNDKGRKRISNFINDGDMSVSDARRIQNQMNNGDAGVLNGDTGIRNFVDRTVRQANARKSMNNNPSGKAHTSKSPFGSLTNN